MNDPERPPLVTDRRGQTPPEQPTPPPPTDQPVQPDTWVIAVYITKNFARLHVEAPPELNISQVEMVLRRAADFERTQEITASVVAALRNALRPVPPPIR